MNVYSRPEWSAFRAEVIRLHDGACNRCARGSEDGVVLQVHHPFYIAGRLPWQYKHDDCEALCQGCHAEEHGKIRPQSGWEHFGFCDDLGGLDGECELCGNSIRYVFPVYHPKWGTMEVGETCCEHLITGAGQELKRVKRRARFAFSDRWIPNKTGVPTTTHKGIVIAVVGVGRLFALQMDGTTGKRRFESELEARMAAFDLAETVTVRAYLSTKRRRRLEAYMSASSNPR